MSPQRSAALFTLLFLQGLVVAIERGTPLAEVLRAQAVDVREVGKRALLEAGGRKEISMMVPVKNDRASCKSVRIGNIGRGPCLGESGADIVRTLE